jgi:Protein of unknown function (DUF2911)
MMPRHLLLAALLLFAAPSASINAQIRASELQVISQIVDGTSIKLTYSRPRLRGRSNVWGTKVVNWGEVWTPGANDATLFENDKDITIGGVAVPKGKYSVWMIVSKDSTWTMLLDPKWKQYHTDHPKPNDTMIRVPVQATLAAPTVEEALTWSFPSVTARGGSIAMQWERTRVTMQFTVTPTLSEFLPEAEATQYVGTYVLTDPKTGKKDDRFIVTYERGGLKARFEPKDDYLQTFALMKVAPNYFTVGLFMSAEVYAGGEIYEVLRPEFMVTFGVSNGKMTVESRGADDTLYFSGVKTP